MVGKNVFIDVIYYWDEPVNVEEEEDGTLYLSLSLLSRRTVHEWEESTATRLNIVEGHGEPDLHAARQPSCLPVCSVNFVLRTHRTSTRIQYVVCVQPDRLYLQTVWLKAEF